MKRVFSFIQPIKYLSFLVILSLLGICVACEKDIPDSPDTSLMVTNNQDTDSFGGNFQINKLDFLDDFDQSEFDIGQIAYSQNILTVFVHFNGKADELGKVYMYILDSNGELVNSIDLYQLFGGHVEIQHVNIDENDFINIFFISPQSDDHIIISSCKITNEAELVGNRTDFLIDNFEISLDNFSINDIYYADDGKIYFLLMSIEPVNNVTLIVFDEIGTELFRVADNSEGFNAWNFGHSLFSDSTDIYVTGRNLSDNEEWYSRILSNDKTIGEKEPAPFSFGGYHIQSADGLYLTDVTGIYWLSKPNGEQKQILNWEDENIDMTNSAARSLVISETKVFVVIYHYGNGSASDSTLYILDKKDNSAIDTRQIIRLAGISIENDLLRQLVYEFNQESFDFRIEIVEYGKGDAGIGHIDYERARRELNLDILAGDLPDILYDSQNFVDFYSLAHDNLFIDLYSMMTEDAEFEAELFYENILSQGEVEGRLCYMPISFEIETLVGERSTLKDINGWTYREFDTFANTLPLNTKVISDQSHTNLLRRILSASMYQFIDVRKNESRFNSSDFIDLLTFCKTYGVSEEMITNNTHSSELEMIKNNELILFAETFDTVLEYGGISGLMEDSIYMVGYPSSTAISPVAKINECFAISASSNYPNQAWDFIKNVINISKQDELVENGSGLPIRKTSMEKGIEIAMKSPEDSSNMGGERIIMDSGFSPILSVENADYFREVLSEISLTEKYDVIILNIVLEESQSFFLNQKTAEDTVSVIQNRAQTRLNEKN